MRNRRYILQIIIFIIVLLVTSMSVYAEPTLPLYKIGVSAEPAQNAKDTAASIQILLLITILSIAPSILIMMTSFTRVIIILSFLRNALGTQQMPPNQVLIGLALFLSLFIMNPVLKDINDNAFQPFAQGRMTQDAALGRASETIKKFMLKTTRPKDLALFVSLSGEKVPDEEKYEKLPITVVTPAFMISELTTAFQIGFIIFIPFLVIDMVVSSTLMSMGMMMLPPILISLPFKILLFVMVDGWNLVTQSIVNSFK